MIGALVAISSDKREARVTRCDKSPLRSMKSMLGLAAARIGDKSRCIAVSLINAPRVGAVTCAGEREVHEPA